MSKFLVGYGNSPPPPTPSPSIPPLGETLTVKNGQILLYFRFNKIINEPTTIFQSPSLGQQHVRNVFHTVHQYLTKFCFDSTQNSKEISITVTSIMQQCLYQYQEFDKSIKIQTSRERSIMFSLNKNIHELHVKGYFMTKNSFVKQIAFKDFQDCEVGDRKFQNLGRIILVLNRG